MFFDLVRNNQRFIQIVLAIIILPFALWGVDSYVNSGNRDIVAEVGSAQISTFEFRNALREQQERLRKQPGTNPALIESPQLRRAVLQELINQHLLRQFAFERGMRISDSLLAAYIASVPSLRDEAGQFSRQRYEALVAAQGMNIDMFEARIRDELLLQQAMMAASNGLHTGKAPLNAFLSAQLEEREIREIKFSADQFYRTAQKPDSAAVAAYYEQNQARFSKPEQVKLEYLVMSQDRLTAAAQVTDADIDAWYKQNGARYSRAEERRASHILLRLEKDAAEDAVKAATAKAEDLLTQIRAKPEDFAKLAKAHSQDPGSAAKGGDLGFFGRGMMVKPFEEATFALLEKQVSGIVRSDFGLHIIQLVAIQPAQMRPLAEVRGEIANELRRQAGQRQFAEAAETFSNLVYEQPDSLQGAAERFSLKLATTDWMVRSGELMPPLNHPKLLQAAFSEDALKQRRNSEAIDIGNNTLVSIRVIEHRPAEVEPLAAVSRNIEEILLHTAALKLAQARGAEVLAALQQGHAAAGTLPTWGKPRSILRMHAPDLTNEARTQVFGVAPDKLPAFVGANLSAGYAVYGVDKVKTFDPTVDAPEAVGRVAGLQQQYSQTILQEETLAWMATLRQRYPVKIKTEQLAKETAG